MDVSGRLGIATHNMHKAREIIDIVSEQLPDLTPRQVVTARDVGMESPVEDGTTFEENALIKARALCSATGLPAIADDSGICVDILGGAPGIFSARWAGTHGNDEENLALLLAQLKDVPVMQRGAHFACAAAAVFPDGTEIVHVGTLEGDLTTSPRGGGGFGYDPIFMADGQDVTNAELAAQVKNQISHRGKAFRALAKEIAPLIPPPPEASQSQAAPATAPQEVVAAREAAAQAAAEAAEAAERAQQALAAAEAAEATYTQEIPAARQEQPHTSSQPDEQADDDVASDAEQVAADTDTAPTEKKQKNPPSARDKKKTDASESAPTGEHESSSSSQPAPEEAAQPLPEDLVKAGLKVVFMGPVSEGSTEFYADKKDQFWSLLSTSGFTRAKIKPGEATRVLSYGVGLTSDEANLKSTIERIQPTWLALNGLDTAKSFAALLNRKAPQLGQQEWQIGSTKVYVLPGSGPDVVGPWGGKQNRAAWWKELAKLISGGR